MSRLDLQSRQCVPNAHRVPAPATRRRNSTRIQSLRNCAQRCRAGLPNFRDDWQDVACRAIGFRLDGRDCCALSRLNIGIAKLDSLRLCRRERRLRPPLRSRRALFRHMPHQAKNEMHVARETIELGDHAWGMQCPRGRAPPPIMVDDRAVSTSTNSQTIPKSLMRRRERVAKLRDRSRVASETKSVRYFCYVLKLIFDAAESPEADPNSRKCASLRA